MSALLEEPPSRVRAAPAPRPQCRIVATPRPHAAFGFGEAAGVADAVRMPLLSLLVGNAVNPGEIVQLVIKPSRWFILLSSVRFAAVVAIVILGSRLPGFERFAPGLLSIQFGVFLVAGRLMWSTVQWMGRYYLLTDQRVIRVCGVFDVDIRSHKLRDVTGIRLYRPSAERLLNRGSLDIAGPDGMMSWQTISQFQQVHDALQLAVMKAKQNGCHG